MLLCNSNTNNGDIVCLLYIKVKNQLTLTLENYYLKFNWLINKRDLFQYFLPFFIRIIYSAKLSILMLEIQTPINNSIDTPNKIFILLKISLIRTIFYV